MIVNKFSQFSMQLEQIKVEVQDEISFSKLNMKLYKKIIRIRLICFFVLEFVILTIYLII